MDNRLILTERQHALVKELYRLFRDFAKEEGRFIPVLEDMKGSLIYHFYNGKNVDYIERTDEYIDYQGVIGDNNVLLDPKFLEKYELDVTLLSGDPYFLLENNQYVRDRILKTIKSVSNTRKQMALNKALGKDGERLANIKKEIKERYLTSIQLTEELRRWEAAGNERMIEITLQDIEVNNHKRSCLKSEAIKLGKVVAKMTREFLSNYKAQ